MVDFGKFDLLTGSWWDCKILSQVAWQLIKVASCVSERKEAMEAMGLGGGGIPTIFVGDILRVEGVQPYEFISMAVKKALAMQANSQSQV